MTFHKNLCIAAATAALLAGGFGIGCRSTSTDDTLEKAQVEAPAPVTPLETTQSEAMPPPAEQAPPAAPESLPETSTSRETAAANVGFKDNVWMPGDEGKLLKGIDGAPYEPYLPSVIEETQQALKDQGAYEGPVTGVLDEETMRAVGDFQEKNGLHVSGVPSPETRKALGISAPEANLT